MGYMTRLGARNAKKIEVDDTTTAQRKKIIVFLFKNSKQRQTRVGTGYKKMSYKQKYCNVMFTPFNQ